jgi:hypothetical protein
MPAHHKLEAFLDEYIRAAGIAGDDKSPLFRSGVRRTGPTSPQQETLPPLRMLRKTV